jgi:hypothetical protein
MYGQVIFMTLRALQSESVCHSEQGGYGEDGRVNHGKTVWTKPLTQAQSRTALHLADQIQGGSFFTMMRRRS